MIVFLDEVENHIFHLQQFLPLLTVQRDREAAHSINGKRSLFTDFQRDLPTRSFEGFILGAEALEFGLHFGFSWHGYMNPTISQRGRMLR